MIELTRVRAYDSVADSGFIYSSWARSFRAASTMRAVPQVLYNKGQTERVDRILKNPDTKIFVLCHKDTPEMIFGFIVVEGEDILHYLFIKPNYRRMGLANFLLKCFDSSKPIIHTHKPSDFAMERWLKTPPGAKFIYNPFILDRSTH